MASICRDQITPTTVMVATATPTPVVPATTTRETGTGFTTGQSILLYSPGLVIMIVLLVDLKALSHQVGPPTPLTTTTTRTPAPPTTREGRSDGKIVFIL